MASAPLALGFNGKNRPLLWRSGFQNMNAVSQNDQRTDCPALTVWGVAF